MSTLRATNIKHESSATNQIVLGADGSIGGTLGDTLAAKADLSGDTFTGDVTIGSANPSLFFDASASGQACSVYLRTGNSLRWRFMKNGNAESGSNAGSDIQLAAYDDSGVFLGYGLIVYRRNLAFYAPGVYSNTSAAAANVYVNTSGQLLRSTSSIKYKTDVQDATDTEQNAIIAGLRPVTYKSLSDSDDPDARFWGFIAEEVEQIDPRLVNHNEDGDPEGVQYDRIIPALVGVVQRQQAQIDALTARLDDAGL